MVTAIYPSKTQYLPKLTYPAVYLEGHKLKQVSEHCQLGLLFHESFNWDAHIKQVIEKSQKHITNLRRISSQVP